MTTHRWLAIPVVLAGGLGAIGCGSGDDPVEKSKYKYPDVPSFCEAKAEAECTDTVLNRCQTTEDACVIKRRGICGQSAPSGASYRPTEAEKCLAAVRVAYQNDEYTAAEKVAEWRRARCSTEEAGWRARRARRTTSAIWTRSCGA